MRKVIATALFGEKHENYANYLPAYVLGSLNLYPKAEDWHHFVYVDEAVNASRYGKFLQDLAAKDIIKVVVMESAPLTKAMLWRVAPVFHTDSGYVFCRDLDAPPMPRDRACMEAFMKSGCDVHTIHDNLHHIGIMGGLCGFNAPSFRESMGLTTSFDDFLHHANLLKLDWAKHGSDQDALNRLIIRPGGPSLCEHRFAGWQNGKPNQTDARLPGKYPNTGRSAKVPDVGFPHPVGSKADQLGNHLGAAGYDHQAAAKFWAEHGNPAVAIVIGLAEMMS